MKNLIDKIRALPGMPEEVTVYPSAWVSRSRVRGLIEDYFAEHPPGMIEVRGCTREKIENCLRVLLDDQKKKKSYRDACRRLIKQVKFAGAVRDRLADDLSDLFQTFEDEAERIYEEVKRCEI